MEPARVTLIRMRKGGNGTSRKTALESFDNNYPPGEVE
jgi:hypothetical protein